MKPGTRAFAVWAALLLLLAATASSAFLPLGPWNAVVNLTIAVAKAGLVAVFFMHLRDARGLVRLAGAVAVFLLIILFALGATDYLNRRVYPAPWQLPTTLDHRSH